MTQQPSPAARRRRLERLNRWRRPLVSRRDRLRAWVNMLAVDHGALRLVYPNRHRVGERAVRMAQPLPHHVRQFARDGGKTVVSLRGGQTFGSLPLEIEACEREGLAFHTLVMRSRSLPSRDELIAAVRLMRALETPVLFHCKSGADRVGFVAALWLALIEGRPVAEARGQLALRYGHVRAGKTGVLDAFFDAYEAETRGEMSLMEWIETRYARDRIMHAFRSRGWGDVLVDRILARE